MKKIYFFLFLFSTPGLLTPFLQAQPIIYVTPTGAGNSSGNSWTNSLPGAELPGRLATASAGTQFWIARGVYKPTPTTDRTASFSIASGVSVYGGFTGNETTLEQRNYAVNKTIFSGDIGIPYDSTDQSALPAWQADNVCHVVYFQDVSVSTQLNGLTIRAGTANLSGGPVSYLLGEGIQANDIGKAGGGIQNVSITTCSTPAILNCLIEQNRASFGSGLYSSGGSCSTSAPFLVNNCVFRDNKSLDFGSGGAMYLHNLPQASISACTFLNNQSFWGGGVFVYNCHPEILNCYFDGNKAGFTGGGSGGGIFVDAFTQPSNPVISNCLFTNNQATSGGAIFAGSFLSGTSTSQFINCSFTENKSSSGAGGAIAIQDSTYRDGYNKQTSNNLPRVWLKNCLLWNNTSYKHESISFGYAAFPTISYSLIGGNFLTEEYATAPPGYNLGHNIHADPHFVSPSTGNFRLANNSPAIDAGDPNTTTLPLKDLAGQLRVQGGRVDIGPYESAPCPSVRCIPFVIERRTKRLSGLHGSN